MRILIVSAFFPPFVQGGAEISARNLAAWLVANGHEVAVLTTSPAPEDEVRGAIVDGLKVWRIHMPRPYAVFEAAQKSGLQKSIWHLQDHFDPRNNWIMRQVLDEFVPDMVNIHVLQGIGWNTLRAIGARNIPVVFTIHDLSLACVRMAMFKSGRECERQCAPCAFSSRAKLGFLRSVPRLGFVSPSLAIFRRLSAFQPIQTWLHDHILNPNKSPDPTVEKEGSRTVRFLYVGRLHESKGLYVLLQALEPLSARHDFKLTLVGTGPSEDDLRRRFGDHRWIEFAGHVSVQEVANRMAQSDLLFVPSIWFENSPGVIVEALGQGLPVMGSNAGGIPELITHEKNGILVEAGDVRAWSAAIEKILDHPERLEAYKDSAGAAMQEFNQDTLGRRVVAFYESVRTLPV
ncbi:MULTISPECIES: glycosyltransferase family 4 protein [Bradyrhizobium]|uniref:glycosyltransferase family 4 protein n=1 Tax=Bradyrhizobium TaxID=374 RepID=UPI001B8A31EC|nr:MULTISPECIES: glycosyltransferase family 4 protein [Bradyrhizobium]MBR0969944.1 glycosyltransferase family 4 protein [Bradyrhizobium japonicum]